MELLIEEHQNNLKAFLEAANRLSESTKKIKEDKSCPEEVVYDTERLLLNHYRNFLYLFNIEAGYAE